MNKLENAFKLTIFGVKRILLWIFVFFVCLIFIGICDMIRLILFGNRTGSLQDIHELNEIGYLTPFFLTNGELVFSECRNSPPYSSIVVFGEIAEMNFDWIFDEQIRNCEVYGNFPGDKKSNNESIQFYPKGEYRIYFPKYIEKILQYIGCEFNIRDNGRYYVTPDWNEMTMIKFCCYGSNCFLLVSTNTMKFIFWGYNR